MRYCFCVFFPRKQNLNFTEVSYGKGNPKCKNQY